MRYWVLEWCADFHGPSVHIVDRFDDMDDAARAWGRANYGTWYPEEDES